MSFILSDQVGQPQKLTDENGNVTWDRVATPYGETYDLQNPGNIDQPLRFPGQQLDNSTSLAYNYFRDYDPSLGRYIQSDPIGLDGGLNTYAYVGGNPVNRVDPKGKDAVTYPDSRSPSTSNLDTKSVSALLGMPSSSTASKASGSNTKICQAADKADCIQQCTRLALPTPDYGIQFFRCMLACQSGGNSGFPDWDKHF